jgi:hypothetical protein
VISSNIKASYKKYLLAFGFLVSFFALSGYVSHSIPGSNRASITEQFTDKIFVLKGGISYKRTVLALRSGALSYAANRQYAIQRIYTDNKLAIIRYQHLSQAFSSTKYYFAYTIDHLYHTADQHNYTSSFRIG